MIIEIKGLPEGRKVKHINVDITFEEDGEVKSIVKTDSKPVEQVITSPDVPSPAGPISTESIPSTDARGSKPIPAEMTDMEF